MSRTGSGVAVACLLFACNDAELETTPAPQPVETVSAPVAPMTFTESLPPPPTTVASGDPMTPCTKDWHPVLGLKPSSSADAISLGSVADSFTGIRFVADDPPLGELCATASDVDACLAALPKRDGHKQRGLLMVTTDESGAKTYRGGDIVNALKPIETEEEAYVTVVAREAVSLACGKHALPGTPPIRPTEGGYLVSAVDGGGCNQRPTDVERVEYFVSIDGVMSERSRKTLYKDPGGCVRN